MGNAAASDAPPNNAATMRDEGIERLKDGLRRDLGPIICAALDDPKVAEIMVNSDGTVWIDRFGSAVIRSDYAVRPSQAMKVMTSVAALLKKVVNAEMPSLKEYCRSMVAASQVPSRHFPLRLVSISARRRSQYSRWKTISKKAR
ncbi:hypothetical protein ACFQAT_28845 [Undibacterium arcticum]|uniref:hypothetical protein n=1 Tax=Undibacterium arcticum TaxID=1762892 RepID=UPI003620AA2A